jgi:membrane fusion protein, multidrug efflux system
MSNGRPIVPLVIGGTVVAILGLGGAMLWHAEAKVNKVALSSSAKPVTIVEAKASSYRASRRYVGTIDPWVEANIGPQLVAAYVDTVLVRPGAVVKKGEVLATLDCRNASATSQSVAMQARALDARQQAVAHESVRVQAMLDGGFVSANEAEQKSAQSAADEAQVLATKARLLGSSLEVNDCILRAPFDGEVASRAFDPGAFVRPGTAMITVVDRGTVRVTADAPEVDFAVVGPGTQVALHVISTGQDLPGIIARRAPAADAATRTVHFEIDVADTHRAIPVGTTAEIRIDVGTPSAASEVPLYAASVRGAKASLFVIEGNVAHARVVPVKGELAGQLFLDPTTLAPGAKVVTEGRALLADGDKVNAGMAAPAVPAPHAKSETP